MNKNPPEPRVIDRKEMEKALQSALFYFSQENPFFGAMIQCLTVRYTTQLPTAAISYSEKNDNYEIILNPQFFCNLTLYERAAILHHEVLHFTNKHLFRLPFISATPEDRKLYNLAGDMAINQYIKDLPKGGIDVKDWKKNDGTPFPTLRAMEEYYELIKVNQQANKKMLQPGPGEGEGAKTLDEHIWESMPEEAKQKMLEEAKKLVKRTLDKTNTGYDKAKDMIGDLLEELEKLTSGINCKKILRDTIKKTVSCADREGTWKRPNKRYHVYAPGTKIGALPSLGMYFDTSGSMSCREINECLGIMDQFLKVGARQCFIGLWHTSLYFTDKYKRGSKFKSNEVQSGGTCVSSVIEHLLKKKHDLTIIFTDGYFENCTTVPPGELLWIITKGGSKDHPMKHLGRTIMLDDLKDTK